MRSSSTRSWFILGRRSDLENLVQDSIAEKWFPPLPTYRPSGSSTATKPQNRRPRSSNTVERDVWTWLKRAENEPRATRGQLVPSTYAFECATMEETLVCFGIDGTPNRAVCRINRLPHVISRFVVLRKGKQTHKIRSIISRTVLGTFARRIVGRYYPKSFRPGNLVRRHFSIPVHADSYHMYIWFTTNDYPHKVYRAGAKLNHTSGQNDDWRHFRTTVHNAGKTFLFTDRNIEKIVCVQITDISIAIYYNELHKILSTMQSV